MAGIRISTTQNIDIEYELASLGDRVVARIVDYLIIIAYFVLIIILWDNFNPINKDATTWFFFLALLPVIFYDLLCEIFFNGQSAGKKARSIKVISLDGEQPVLRQYILRCLFRIVDFTLTSNIAGVLSVGISPKHQRLGDMVAGTTVVKTKMRTVIEDTLFTPVEAPSYEARYPEVIQLSDSDVQLLKDVVVNYQNTGNYLLVEQAKAKIESILHISNRETNALDFLKLLIADYNHVTSAL